MKRPVIIHAWKLEANVRKHHNGAALGYTIPGEMELSNDVSLDEAVPGILDRLKAEMEADGMPILDSLRLTIAPGTIQPSPIPQSGTNSPQG